MPRKSLKSISKENSACGSDILNETNLKSQDLNSSKSEKSNQTNEKETSFKDLNLTKITPSQIENEQIIDKELNSHSEPNLKVNDIVWAKLIGYSYWPAKIVDLIYRQPQNESTPNLKSKSNTKTTLMSRIELMHYKVLFYGNKTTGLILKNDIKLFSSRVEDEPKHRGRKNSMYLKAIKEARADLENSKLFDSSDYLKDEVKTTDKSLLSIEEELKLIKNAVNSDINKENNTLDDSQLDELTESKINSSFSPKESKSNKANNNNLLSKKLPRSSAIIAASNLCLQRTPSQLQKQRSKIASLKGQDLDEAFSSAKKAYEFIKSSKSFNTDKLGKTKKRSRSSDKVENDKNEKLNTSLEKEILENSSKTIENFFTEQKFKKKRDDSFNDELNFNLEKNETSFIDRNFESRSSSPIDISFDIKSSLFSESFVFNSISIIINSSDDMNINKNLVWKLIETFNQIVNEFLKSKNSLIRIYDISLNNNSSSINNVVEYLNSKYKEFKLKLSHEEKTCAKLEFEQDFKKVLESELILSCVFKPTSNDFNLNNSNNNQNENNTNKFEDINFSIYEKNLLSSNLNRINYISLCPLDYDDAVFYHYYFRDNGSNFIEAPVIELIDNHKIYVSCWNKDFSESIKCFFNFLVGKNNVIMMDSKLGLPSTLVSLVQPLLPIFKINKIYFNKIKCLVPNLTSVKFLKLEEENKTDEDKNKKKELNLEFSCLIQSQLKQLYSNLFETSEINYPSNGINKEVKKSLELNIKKLIQDFI